MDTLTIKPIAQLLYYPEQEIPYVLNPRKGVLKINRVYNPFPKFQKLGIAERLVKSLIKDCIGKYGFLVTYPFETGEFFSQKEFFQKLGFKKLDHELYYALEGRRPTSFAECKYEPKEEDLGKTFVFFERTCEFSYAFSIKIKERLMNLSKKYEKDIGVELINAWENPKEFISKGCNHLVVNSRPIMSFYGIDEFEKELKMPLSFELRIY